jgi:hypothetical protein
LIVIAGEEAFAVAPVVDFPPGQPGTPIMRGVNLPWDFELSYSLALA